MVTLILNGKFLFVFFYFGRFSVVPFLLPSLCSTLHVQRFLPPSSSLDLCSGIGCNVGILMLLPHSDVRMLQNQSHGQLLGLVPDSKAVSLSFCFPRQWVGNCLFAASFHELLTLRPKRGSCPPTCWESTFISRPTAGDKILGFQNRPTGVLRLQTCQALFQFHF